MSKKPAVYMMASKPKGTLYIGVTSNLPQRIWQHKNEVVDGFTKKYFTHTLVYYEVHETMESAIVREKQLKHFKREWKIELIDEQNPDWKDLYDTIA